MHVKINTNCRYDSTTTNIIEITEDCISEPGATEGFPLNDTALIYINLKQNFKIA